MDDTLAPDVANGVLEVEVMEGVRLEVDVAMEVVVLDAVVAVLLGVMVVELELETFKLDDAVGRTLELEDRLLGSHDEALVGDAVYELDSEVEVGVVCNVLEDVFAASD